MDVDAVDFGLVSYSYRYTKEFTLTNVCPIPMQYEWRLPKDHQLAAKKEFTVSGLLAHPYKHQCTFSACQAKTILVATFAWYSTQVTLMWKI